MSTKWLPKGATLVKNGEYLRVENCFDHPLSTILGRIPYHRLVLFEQLGRPVSSECHWCRYPLPWKCSGQIASFVVVCADHLDGNKSNNSIGNLVPSCSWCNANRSWAERFPEFWSQWRRWMADVPPSFRPNLQNIAAELGLKTPKNEA